MNSDHMSHEDVDAGALSVSKRAMCVLWYHQCLSAPPSHALSEGDAPVPLWSITLAGRTETHALSAVCTTPSLLYCLPICPSACCYKQSHHFQRQSGAGSQVRKREKQVTPHSAPGMLLPPPPAPTCFRCLSRMPWTGLGRNPGN